VNKALIPLLFGGRGFPGWDVDLDLMAYPLDPRVVFSRASLATRSDESGRLRFADHNLISWSENFSDASWTKAGAVPAAVTANAAQAPDGSNTAALIDLSGSADARIATNPSVGFGGFSVTASVWLRAPAGQSGTVALQLRRADGSTPSTLVTLTEAWQRFVFTASAVVGGNSPLFWCGSRGAGGTQHVFYAWGAQLEISDTAGPYRRTAGTPFHGPRIDYNPVTLEKRGTLLEESRTNLVRNSQMTGGSAGVWPTNWSGVAQAGVTATPGPPTVDPATGYTYLDVVFSGTATSTGDLRVNFEAATGVAGAAGQTRTWSAVTAVVAGAVPAGRQVVYSVVERDAGQAALNAVDLGLANASPALTRTASSTRTLAAAAVAFANGFIKIGVVSGDACNFTLRIAAPQCEAGVGASSYIPTVGASVSRSLDLAHIAHSGTTPGTLFAEALGLATSVDSFPPLATAAAGGDGTNRAQLFLVAGPTLVSGGLREDVGGAAQVNSAAPSTRLIANPVRVAARLQVDNFQCVQMGGSAFSDSAGEVPGTTVVALGGGFQGNQSGLKWLRRVAWRRAPMSSQQLERVVAL
jgi:hypothetical protein